MEIIYFLPDVDAGVTSIVRNLLRYRPKSEIIYKVIFTRLIEREAVHITDNFNVHEQITFKYSKYENLFTVFKRLKNHISSENTILVANDGLELRMVRALKLKNPMTYIIHGDFGYYYQLSGQNQGIIDHFISYSIFTKEQLSHKLEKQNINKISLLYYPVPVAKNVTQNQCNKNIDILFVGSFVARKGVQYLKGIYEKVVEKLPDVRIMMVGSGEMENELRDQLKSIRNVHFKGQLKNHEVIETMQYAKTLVFPSLSEGLPNVVVEAMKAECVPVCSDISSGIPDLITDGETGFKNKIGDEEAFASKLVLLLSDENSRLKIAKKGRKKAEEMFEPHKQAQQYEQAIKSTPLNNKVYPEYSLGGVLNKPYIPNLLVKIVRKLNISNKL